MSESREIIKNRMLRTLAKMWGYPGVEDETSFDPVVGFLINACAAELEKINREKSLSQSRLTEELARLLTPESESRARPAHAIARAVPVKPAGWIDEHRQFFFNQNELDHSADSEELCFSPTGRFPLIQAEVKYQASHNLLFEIIEQQYKNVAGYTDQGRYLPAGSLYLGIEMSQVIREADEVTFFFSKLNGNSSGSGKDLFFEHLKNSSWFLGEREIDKVSGFPSTVSGNADLRKLLDNKYTSNDRACRYINHFYSHQFLTVKNITGLGFARGEIPDEITSSFRADVLDQLNKELVWLRVEFPKAVSHEWLNDLLCFTNCFPVLNRFKHDSMHRLKENLNIIPLKSKDFFFDIRQVFDTTGNKYHLYDHNENKNPAEEDGVLLRTSGVSRFGTEEASEVLQHLIETLKDETASYAAIGTEAITETVDKMNRLIAELEEKVSGMPIKETVSYLLMRNLKGHKSLFVEYWSTGGERANNIKPGTILDSVTGADVQHKNAVLITSTVGGKNRLTDEEKLISMRQALLSKERLVTSEDIRIFCFSRLGKRISQVEITKGLANGFSGKEGLVRTIDIILTPNNEVDTTEKEWEYLLEEVLSNIRMRVAHSFPYRISLKNTVASDATFNYQFNTNGSKP